MPNLPSLCARHPRLVLSVALLAAALSLLLVHTRLGVTTDTGLLFDARLPWKRNAAVLQRAFPQNEDMLVVVIDATLPEEAELTARDLATALAIDHAHFSSVSQPDGTPYFARNAFLFLDLPALRDVLDRTIDAQPFLGKLAADPSLRGLCGAIALIAEGVETGQADPAAFQPALGQFAHALAGTAPLSWERLLAGPVANLAGRYHFVLVKPRLAFGDITPGAEASDAIRAAAARLPFVRDGSARVRLTGSVALDDEEFATVAQGAVTGLLASAALVTLWLFLAVRSWLVVVPVLLTLLFGLLATAGFAAASVGTLNLVSVAFAILFVGIAVDFAIQLAVRTRAAQFEAGGDVVAGLARTGGDAGPQILVAALATAAGFLAFTPTSFAGVAQLGLIAGIGMLIAFASTMTVLPALLAVFRPRGGARDGGLAMARRLDPLVQRRRRPLVLLFAVLAVLGLAALPRLRFDSDPLHTKNADTEAMRTLADLIDDPVTNPYTMEFLAPDAASVTALASRLKTLPSVDDVLWVRSFVPAQQAEKLPLIEDAASLLAVTLAPPASRPPVTAPDLRQAVGSLARQLDAVEGRLASGDALARLAVTLARLAQAPDSTLVAADAAIGRFLPMQLERLRLALTATATTEADLPASLRADWIAPDGRLRVQVTPKSTVRGDAALHRFVAEVQGVVPEAAGAAVTIVRSADTVLSAFRIAAVGAVAAITLILVAALRRATDVLLVLAALLLSSLLTVLASVLLGMPLNFANIIALPLLLGVGVSFNIYFVMNWRAGQTRPLGSATARAVLFSALTTGTAFGSLALSHHPGTASMGLLLLLSLGCTLVTTLVFLPALLATLRPRS